MEARTNREVSSVAAAFRKMKLRELLMIYKNQKLSESVEVGQIVREWIAAEICKLNIIRNAAGKHIERNTAN